MQSDIATLPRGFSPSPSIVVINFTTVTTTFPSEGIHSD